jgi:ketosteroid isomerase-like protein
MATETPSAQLETVEAMYRAVQEGDIDGALARMHPDIVVHEADSIPFYGGVHNGKDAFRRDLVGPMFDNYDIEIHQVTARDAGDVVAVFIDMTFTSKATSKSIRMPIVEVSTLADGLIRNMDIYYKDSAAMAATFPEGLQHFGRAGLRRRARVDPHR